MIIRSVQAKANDAEYTKGKVKEATLDHRGA